MSKMPCAGYACTMPGDINLEASSACTLEKRTKELFHSFLTVQESDKVENKALTLAWDYKASIPTDTH